MKRSLKSLSIAAFALSFGALGGCATLDGMSTTQKVGAVAGAVVLNLATGGTHNIPFALHSAYTAAGAGAGAVVAPVVADKVGAK